MAIIGYGRTSTREQEAGLQAQIRDLIAAGCAERDIYTEQVSSVRERPELDLLRRRILRARLDCLARSTFDPFAIVKRIVDAGGQFRSLAELWADMATSTGRLMMA